MKIFILILFILTYVSIVAFSKRKTIITGVSALIAVSACLIGGVATFKEAITAIDYNVILMLLGIMITVGVFSASNMPMLMADKIISKVPNSIIALTLLAVLSGVISAFVDNVATVLMLAPIGLAVAKKINVSPIPVIISIAVSSNLQGAATLVGDTTSIMLGGFADMSFFDFFFLDGKLSIFWAVELGMLLTIPVILFIFRKDNKKLLYEAEKIEIKSYMPTILLLLNIGLLVVTSFLPNKLAITNGLICMVIGLFAIAYDTLRYKTPIVQTLKDSVDYGTVLFLTFLFLIIFTVEKVGIIADISGFFAKIGATNVFLLYTLIVLGSVFMSAFIDNIPYVATMLPVIQTLSLSLPTVSPYLLYFGLLIGATLGGNITPVGASANVVGIGILNKEGHEVKNSDFFKIGIPFTFVAVLGGYLLTWFVWA